MTNRKEKVLSTFKGQIVKAHFVTKKGSRDFWGVLKREARDPDNIVTAYDFRKKAYRRFNLDNHFAIANARKCASSLLEGITAYDLR